MATVPPRQHASRTPVRSKKHIQYTSPRCELEDEEFLPTQSLQEHDERWKHMQHQAGSHRQDGTVLDLTNRQTSPQTLRVGVPPQMALRVRELHIIFDAEYSLPEWLDVVCSLFFQLQHLYTTSKYEEAEMNTEASRMRRLYILYRLPDLVSIDGKQVTLAERQLARPSSPNGHRVKREDWVVSDAESSSQSDESDDDTLLTHHGDAVEVSLFGVVKRVNADPPKEEWDEPELPQPFEPPQQQQPEVKTVTKSVETAYQNMGKPKDVKTPTSCGNFGLAAAFADGNPCVGSRRGPLDEPHTVDYPTERSTRRSIQVQVSDEPFHENGKARGSNAAVPSLYKKEGHSKKRDASDATSPDRIEQRLSTPNRGSSPTGEMKASPSTSLSSPFPMQFRSKSFNGALPSRASRNGGLLRKLSSPDLSPQDKNKETIDSIPSSKLISSPKSKRTQRAERPPPCPPGSSRRVAPVQMNRTRRRSWRSKNSIRSTSIVDGVEEEEESMTDDEDVIEHE